MKRTGRQKDIVTPEKKQEQRELLRLFSANIRKILKNTDLLADDLQEIRLRTGAPLLVVAKDQEYFLTPDGALTGEWEKGYPVSPTDIRDTMDYIGSFSLYAYEDELRQGFLTVEGGHRIGIAGKTVIEGEKDTKAEYLSWDHAPEGVKFEFEVLLRLIYSLTQTPDISFESVKGLGNISGVALKLLFMDAHLKCYDKIETFEDVILRRLSIVRSYIGVMNNSLKKSAEEVNIKPKFTPFMIDDKKEWVETLVTANGGRPVVSQKRSVELADLSNDPEAEYNQIVEEMEKEQTYDVFGQGM